jgi:hypothetical protein
LEDEGIDRRIILNWILRIIRWGGVDWMWLRIGTSGTLMCVHGNEPSGFIKEVEFLD